MRLISERTSLDLLFLHIKAWVDKSDNEEEKGTRETTDTGDQENLSIIRGVNHPATEVAQTARAHCIEHSQQSIDCSFVVGRSELGHGHVDEVGALVRYHSDRNLESEG